MLPLPPRPRKRTIRAKNNGTEKPILLSLSVKKRLERSAELVGAKPLHLLTQTALPLKSPTGAFIAAQTRSLQTQN